MFSFLIYVVLIAAALFAFFGNGSGPDDASGPKTETAAAKAPDPRLVALLDPARFGEGALVFNLPGENGESNISPEEYKLACDNAMLSDYEISSHKYGYGEFSELYSTGAAEVVPGKLEWLESGVCIGSFTVSGTLRGTPLVRKGYATVSIFDLVAESNGSGHFLVARTSGPRNMP